MPVNITTSAPLPSGRHWRRLLTVPPIGDSVLAAPWMRAGDQAFWFSRGAWALRAIADALRAMTDRPPCIWLPDYFCNQATLPLRDAGAQLIFYPVDGTLQPAWQACAMQARDHRPDLFVLVHYFGFPSNAGAARDFCNRTGAALIEDAAHVLSPTATIGETGDFVIYSQYKHLPTPDGGLLIVRPSADRFLAAIDTAAHSLARISPTVTIWALKRLLQTTAPGIVARLGNASTRRFDDDPDSAPLPIRGALSPMARRLITLFTAEIAEIAASRRANELALRTAFAGAAGIAPLFATPGRDVAPWRGVFRATDHTAAELLFDRIRAAGHVVESWPDMPPEVRAAPEHHRAALELRRTVLALPVNAGLTPGVLTAAYGAAV